MAETLEELRKQFFVDELGLDEKDIAGAEQSLLGVCSALNEFELSLL